MIGPNGDNIDTYVLLDEGSTITLINEKLARDLNTRGLKISLALKGINDKGVITYNSEKVNFSVEGIFGRFEIKGAVTVKNLQLPSQTITHQLVSQLQKLEKGVKIKPYYNAIVKVLIGQDNLKLIATRELKEIKNSNIAISRSLLGWSVHGLVSQISRSMHKVLNVKEMPLMSATTRGDESYSEETRLDNLIKHYFEIESMGIDTNMKLKSEHDHALKILNETSRCLGKHWETGLLWKEKDAPNLNSYLTAKKRLFSLEQRLDRDPNFASLYYREIKRFLDHGYAVKVDESMERSRIWYLPHFGVYNINKPDKIRFVFDAAARTSGVSLNDQLESGPDLLQSLVGIMLRFRQYVVAFIADIKDMFLRVKVIEKDRGAQRFLWRGKNREKEPEIYEMASLIFGAKSSPCNAIFVKNKNAERFSKSNPDASLSVIRNSYMDDYLASRKTEHEAEKLINDVIKINAEANFEMYGWASNAPQVLKNISNVKNSVNEQEMRLCDRGGERVLGLHWDTQTDELKFNVKFSKIPKEILNGEKKPTKREFLQVIMSVFDPLGLISPFTLKSKIIMQEIWRSGIGWDDKLREEEYVGWLEWVAKLNVIKECRVPRCYMTNAQQAKAQLHVFSDASLTAYATAAYLRFEYEDGSTRVTLIMSKSRVAPLKPLSVPRLELQAALLGARLAKFIENEIEIDINERFLWSDSSTVLHWINSEPRVRQVFVANRLGEIGELTRNSEWRWVPTAQNPADDATRFLNDALKLNSRWFNRPDFLKQPESEWPKGKFLSAEEKSSIDKLEMRKIYIYSISAKITDLPFTTRLLGWRGLLVYARRIRAASKRWRHVVDMGTPIQVVKESENYWYRVIQSDCFQTEMSELKKGKDVAKSSKIANLSPFLDQNQILRANGRVNLVNENFENQPIILDSNHYATRLLISEYHRKYYHSSNNTVLNELRQKYYILGLRNTLRSISCKCLVCRLRRGKPKNPLMANLPEGRMAIRQRPFSHCGIDYFGPMYVKIGRRREKRWGVLFTCLTTRAIHIELAHSLNTSSAIMSIQRLAARRGVPLVMYSDNGTNFQGASKELKEEIETIDNDGINDFMLKKGIEWRFNPPDAPHMGGAWERMIRSVKVALNATLCEQAPSEEVLNTLLVEIEHSVNSRPLTHVSLDPRDKEAVTPNHILIGTSSGEVQLGRYDAKYISPQKQYRLSQHYADCFWKRWLREYLPSLIPRKKWLEKQTPLQVNDIVLIVDLDSPRNYWRKGVILKVFPGKDGQVRAAEVSTPQGTLVRPTHKLILLWGSKEVQN